MEYMIQVYGQVNVEVEETYNIEADSQEEAIRIFNEKYSDEQLISDLGSSVDVVVSNNPDSVEITDIMISSDMEEFEEDDSHVKQFSKFVSIDEVEE